MKKVILFLIGCLLPLGLFGQQETESADLSDPLIMWRLLYFDVSDLDDPVLSGIARWSLETEPTPELLKELK